MKPVIGLTSFVEGSPLGALEVAGSADAVRLRSRRLDGRRPAGAAAA